MTNFGCEEHHLTPLTPSMQTGNIEVDGGANLAETLFTERNAGCFPPQEVYDDSPQEMYDNWDDENESEDLYDFDSDEYEDLPSSNPRKLDEYASVKNKSEQNPQSVSKTNDAKTSKSTKTDDDVPKRPALEEPPPAIPPRSYTVQQNTEDRKKVRRLPIIKEPVDIYGDTPAITTAFWHNKLDSNQHERGHIMQTTKMKTHLFNQSAASKESTENYSTQINQHKTMFNANVSVDGMAVSESDIALVSRNDRCIVIYNSDCNTYSKISYKSKLLSEPFDATYTRDNNGKLGLYFTEADEKKKGVKVLYKRDRKLKFNTFTHLVDDPRGISADDTNIYVCDYAKQSILVFRKADGCRTHAISRRYSRFTIPTYVFAHGASKLIVSDQNERKVTVLSGLDDSCTLIDEFFPTDFHQNGMTPGKCCVDGLGSVLIPDALNREIYNAYSKEKCGFRTLSRKPVAIAIKNTFQFIVATRDGQILLVTLHGHI